MIAVKDPTNGSPFPGNIVPSSRLDKNGQALLNLFPLPNMTDRSISKGNYNYNFPNSWQAPKRNQLRQTGFSSHRQGPPFGAPLALVGRPRRSRCERRFQWRLAYA